MESYITASKPSTINNTSTCDTPSIKVTIRDGVIWSHFIRILKNVSCDYDGWVVILKSRSLVFFVLFL